MKLKKKSKIIIAAVCAFVLAVAVAVPIAVNAFSQSKIEKYLNEDIKNAGGIRIIADSGETDELKNTVAGFKETVRRGADGVRVDLCFNTDGIPVCTDDYSAADSAVPLEDFFKAMKEDGFTEIKLYLNIIQLSKMTQLNRLATEYELLDRLYLVGIDKNHYGLITSDDTIVPFYLTYEPENECDGKEAYELTNEYGASGVVISSANASAESIDSLRDFSVPFCVQTDSDEEFCSAALDGAEKIFVSDAQSARGILDRWIKAMQKRNASSVEDYLNSFAADT